MGFFLYIKYFTYLNISDWTFYELFQCLQELRSMYVNCSMIAGQGNIIVFLTIWLFLSFFGFDNLLYWR
jgi:hypothetical protein